MVEIIKDFEGAPPGFSRHVRLALGWIHEADLIGLGSIHIADELIDHSANTPEWYKLAKKERFNIDGLYLEKRGQTPARIKLFVNDICRGIPRIYWPTPVLTLRMSRILAHEVAHHLVAIRGYVFQPREQLDKPEYEEEFADRYAFGVLKRMKARWYYRLAHRATKNLANAHYGFGAADWKARKYQEAASHWYIAWVLNPDLEDAHYWWRRAKQMYTKVDE
jgi:hypothetical protein